MLPSRDMYTRDYVYKYLPNVSYDAFQRDMFDNQKSQLHIVAFEDQDSKQISDIYVGSMYGLTFTLTTSVGLILLYNRIPGLRRIQHKWGKFFFKVGLLFIPVNLLSSFNIARTDSLMYNLYQKYYNNYVGYKITGDNKKLNPKTKSKFFF